MTEVGVHEAKTHLSDLLRRVESGEDIVITRDGEPVAHLVLVPKASTRIFGLDEGVFEVPDDFDESLPADMIELFYS